MEKERLLRQALKMEAIGTLASGIAHDFNNILSSVIGFSEIALFDEIPEDSPARFSIEQVVNAGHRAKSLVGQILTFSRQGEHKKEPIGVHPIIKEAVKLLWATIPSNIDIRMTLEVEDGMILGNPTQVHQVILNLCTNSAYAMREKGGGVGNQSDRSGT